MAAPGETSSYVVVGRVRGARGQRGEVLVEAMSDFPGRFEAGESVFIEGLAHSIKASRWLGPTGILLALEGIASSQEARALQGQLVTVPRNSSPPLPEGQFYHHQLHGMAVFSTSGEYLGSITDILTTGSNDVYVVTQGKQEILVPALDDVVLEVDLHEQRMTVDLPEGLR